MKINNCIDCMNINRTGYKNVLCPSCKLPVITNELEELKAAHLVLRSAYETLSEEYELLRQRLLRLES